MTADLMVGAHPPVPAILVDLFVLTAPTDVLVLARYDEKSKRVNV